MYQPCQPSHIPDLPGPRLCKHEHQHLLEALGCAQAVQKAALGDNPDPMDRTKYVIYDTEADLLVTPEQVDQAYTQAQ